MALIIILVLAVYIWFGVRILRKAGLSGYWAITLIIPFVNIAMIWAFAFARWPAVDDAVPPPRPPASTISDQG